MSPTEAETGQGPLWLGRLLSVLGVAILFGSLVTIAAAWPEGVEYLVAVRFIRMIWIVALLGTVLYVAAATAAATGGSFGSGLNPSNWLDLFDAGAPGIAAIARLILVLGSGWVAFRPDRVIDPTTQMAALGIPALAVATMGFSRTGGDLAVIGIATGMLHALAMAIWIGGVVLLARVVLAGPGEEDLVHAVRGFCRISNLAIIVTVVTGLIQTVRLDGGDLFGSSHGRVLLLKTVAVAIMLFIAIKARQFVNDRLARADEMTVPMADRLRRAFGTEAAIGIVAVALSAWMFALTPPNSDTGTSIDYAIEQHFEVPEGDLDVTVKLTQDTPGLVGMEVEVDAPESGMSQLVVVFTAPAEPRRRHDHPAGSAHRGGRGREARGERPAAHRGRHVAGSGQCGHRGRRGRARSADVRDQQRRRFDTDHGPHDPTRRDRHHRRRHHHRLNLSRVRHNATGCAGSGAPSA